LLQLCKKRRLCPILTANGGYLTVEFTVYLMDPKLSKNIMMFVPNVN
jgi:hypothetical protein